MEKEILYNVKVTGSGLSLEIKGVRYIEFSDTKDLTLFIEDDNEYRLPVSENMSISIVSYKGEE